MKETEPDLHNVDYEDVLHLYRGWRKAEGSLKEKNKELNALKIRVKQLQESHIKFRGQIQALESVKELTVSLQTQLSTTQQENVSLVNENKELKSLNAQAEDMLRERANQEAEQTKAFRDVSNDMPVHGNEPMKHRPIPTSTNRLSSPLSLSHTHPTHTRYHRSK